ncbi:MAG: bifunctional (p)ppGpp synthetase/guanosine-3',5'-bis(diphosphate) 3'-pyrophosphohydrolase [Methylomicrobium sp.]
MLQLADSLELERPQDKLIRRLCSILESYMDQAQINEVLRAYQYGAEAHAGQFRKSGEAYICHPIAVAISLAEMRMDAKGIMAALLHDVIEDTYVSKEDLSRLFSIEVAELVDGVTKLSKIDSKSRAEAQAENVRKMFLAMTKDLRVIMVKLADRLHNMQTLGSMPPEKKRRIARETLDIYAPIANRLGMNHVRHQLESLGFRALYPGRHAVLKNAVKKARGNRREIVEIIQNSIKNRLHEAGLECEVEGREKNLYSIYQKMLNKKISFNDVFDVYAFRILCDQVDTCYRALGVVHNLYKPVPGRFKDYIALSKANGYQSLHTILIGPYGVPIEIQIRTHEMHRMSESGIAAHWLYKSDGDKSEHAQARANEWLRELLEIHKSAGNSLEFIDNLKIDLYPQEVFVFTPQGGIIKLPRGATIVDFAYAVHTDIGNSCVSARVDKQLVPLQTQLENGMTVEVITASWARPNPLWLNYVVTAKARSSIRAYLKHFKQQEAISLGRRLLEKELQGMSLQLEAIPNERVNKLLEVLSVPSLDVLLEEIGLGNKMPFLVAKRLSQDDVASTVKLNDNEQGVNSPLIIKGTEGMVVTLAKCCRPIPGDSIVGFFNPGRGIVVHHHECRNSSDSRKKQTGWLDVEWSKDTSGEFPAEIRIELLNRRGTLATVAATISEMDSNIENVTVVDQDDRVSVDLITLTVKDRVHLANIMRRLKKLTIVLKITRVKA